MRSSLSKYPFLLALVWAAIGISIAACGGSSTSTQPTSPASSGSVEGTGNQVFVRLEDPLDEPEFYCLDIPGAGTGVNLRAPIQVHTCKALGQAEDELFMLNFPDQGQIYMKAYVRCVEASQSLPGVPVNLEYCSESPLQRFAYDSEGRLLLEDGSEETLCLAVAPGLGTPTGGPSHLRRDLKLQACDAVEASLTRWLLDDSEDPSIPRGSE